VVLELADGTPAEEERAERLLREVSATWQETP